MTPLTNAFLLLHDLGGPVAELGLHGGVRQEAGVGRHGSAVAHGGVAVAVAVDRESVAAPVGHLGGSGGGGSGGGSVVDGAERAAAAVASAAVAVGHAVGHAVANAVLVSV